MYNVHVCLQFFKNYRIPFSFYSEITKSCNFKINLAGMFLGFSSTLKSFETKFE